MSFAKSNTVHPSDTREAIAARMGAVRSELSSDVEGISQTVREATDWRHQVRSHPVAAAGLAAAVGFWLVPSRPVVRRPDAETLAKLARQEKLVVTDKPTEEQQSGLIAAAMAVGANFALRAATAYLGQQAGRMFGESSGETEASA